MKILTWKQPGEMPLVWLDLLLFKASWLALVIFQSSAVIPVVIVIMYKVLTLQDSSQSLLIAFFTALAGLTMDILLTGAGLFVFPDQIFPEWFVLLWLSFALTLQKGFSFVGKTHPGIQALTGFLAGTIGYYAGFFLGAIEFGLPLGTSLLIIGLLWMFFIPLFFWVNKKILTSK